MQIGLGLDQFGTRLDRAAKRGGLVVCPLGLVNTHPLWFVEPADRRSGLHNVLIAGVFHGEEPAGGLGILEFLESASHDLLSSVNASFLPLVNPTGFSTGSRYNHMGENPNDGYVASACGGVAPSLEGHILLSHISHLKIAAGSCFVSLHEDASFKECYLYTFESRDSPGPFTHMLKSALLKHFQLTRLAVIDGARSVDGVIFNHPDGTFEHRLFEEGVPSAACTETPGRLELASRVAANRDIVEACCLFYSQ